MARRVAALWFSFLLGALFVAVTARAECTRMIVSADPAYPPLHWYGGQQLKGASIEIAKRVLEGAGIPYEIRFEGPFVRMLESARQGRIDMVATLKSTPEREEFLLFPKTPAYINPVSVFVPRNSTLRFQGWDDLIGHTGGITKGNKFGGEFDEFLEKKLTIEESISPEHNFEKLKLGRIEYLITGYYTGMAFLAKHGDEDKFVALKPFIVETPNYLALTRAGKCVDKLKVINEQLAILKSPEPLSGL